MSARNVWVDQRRNLSHSCGARCRSGTGQKPRRGRIQRGKQVARTVFVCVVRHGAPPRASAASQAGYDPELESGSLIGAQHQCVFRRMRYKPTDVFQFLREGRIVADLEGLHAMRLNRGRADAPHAGFADAAAAAMVRRAPVRGVVRLLARGHVTTVYQAGADRRFTSRRGALSATPPP